MFLNSINTIRAKRKMSNEILGTDFRYIVDVSYGINQDGFIAIGTESIVYKGIKVAQSGDLEFSCVLKFKPKHSYLNGEYKDKVKKFKEDEFSIFEELKECRSVVKIFDVIEDMGSFTLKCDRVSSGVITGENYFCVVEEYIDGWSLEEYCRSEFWKLRKYEETGNGLKKVIEYHDFRDDEKENVRATYYKNYDNILMYQNQIIHFMRNLCEILEFVTEKKRILHLDIKPENIMVTKHGKELVLIDFGRSVRLPSSEKFFQCSMERADYSTDETIDRMYSYSTIGYAAPECYAPAAENSEYPFEQKSLRGKMSIESDIFSFGASFWECLNIFDLVTKGSGFSRDSHEFYRKYFLNDDAYTSRDLSLTSVHYHQKLEDIIRKCTRKRSEGYTDPSDRRYYHSYSEIKRDIIEAENSVPNIVRAENIRVRSAFSLVGKALSVFTTILIVIFVFRLLGYRLAYSKWERLTENYRSTQFSRLETIATDLVKTVPNSGFGDVYRKISEFTYLDGEIDEQEAALLVSLLDKRKSSISEQYIDEIMQFADPRKFKEISSEIMKLDIEEAGLGHKFACAIYNTEIKKENYAEAYELLSQYHKNTQFRNAAVKLKNILDNDDTIDIISEKTGVGKSDIKELFEKTGDYT